MSGRFVLNVTNRCNRRCRTCLRERFGNLDLDPERLRKALPYFTRLGLKRAAITGGEPLLNPMLDDILALLARSGISFGIVTNGSMQEEYREHLAPYREAILYVAVSLDSHLEELCDDIRGPWAFAEAVHAIRNYMADGYTVCIGHTITSLTASLIDDFVAWVRESFGSTIGIHLARMIATNSNADLMPDSRQVSRLQERIGILASRFPETLSWTTNFGRNLKIGFCNNLVNITGITDVVLRYDGLFQFCCDVLTDNHGATIGNVDIDPPEIVFNNYLMLRELLFRRRSEAMASGHIDTDNDCDFCNRILRENGFVALDP